jgi:hypothetical protein
LTIERRSGRSAGGKPAENGGSRRTGVPADRASSGRSGASRPAPGARRATGDAGDASAMEQAKQRLVMFMFVGTGVLIPVLIGLLIWKKPWESPPPPPPKVTIDENVKVTEVKKMREKAAKTFAEAKKLTDQKARNAKIREALDLLGEGVDKLQELSEKYQGEEYDQVFEPLMNGMTQDMKSYREAIRLQE